MFTLGLKVILEVFAVRGEDVCSVDLVTRSLGGGGSVGGAGN